jgi:hypothetical protein
MYRRSRRLSGFAAIVAVVVGACGSSSTPSPAPASAAAQQTAATASPTAATLPTSAPDATSEPVTEPTPSTGPTSTPTPTATPKPTLAPTVKPAATGPTSAVGWTAPRALIDSAGCQDVTAAVDQAGRYHLAATCGDGIRIYDSTGSSSWSTRVFVHPAGRAELAPQVAIVGNVEYVAYYRIAPDGGCGSLGTDIGVYFRSRTLPNGAWSVATKVGAVADELQSLAASGSTIFMTVKNDQALYFVSRAGSSVHRTLIPNAGGWSSVAVGSDGRARVAYVGATGLRIGVYTGTSLSSSRIGGSTDRDWAPKLMLDAADKPHVVWTRSPAPGGCAGPGPEPDDGTYYATDASGSWVKHRITTATGPTTFDMDAATGRVYTVVGTDSGLRSYTRASNGSWSGVLVAATTASTWADSPVVRFNRATGALFVAFMFNPASGPSHIYVVSKP